jgi:hypothetical protein
MQGTLGAKLRCAIDAADKNPPRASAAK